MPPHWMWPLDDELGKWFEDVERKRKEKYGGLNDGDEEPADMMSNELARGRK